MTLQIQDGKRAHKTQIHSPTFVREANLETRKQVCISESSRSIESLQEQLQIERSQLDLALQQYRPRGSLSDALEALVQELVDAEQQELDERGQVAEYLQRLEELDNQVSTSCTAPSTSLLDG